MPFMLPKDSEPGSSGTGTAGEITELRCGNPDQDYDEIAEDIIDFFRSIFDGCH
jgi:hypothetical protein